MPIPFPFEPEEIARLSATISPSVPGIDLAAGEAGAAGALKAGRGFDFGKASVPGIAQGEDLGGKRLSETIGPGMKMASQLLGLGGKLSGNPKAENIMNLMAAATGAAGSSGDPQKALKAMEGPLSGITANLEKEEAAKQKRLSESLQPNQSLLDRQKAASAQAAPAPTTAAGPSPATSLLPNAVGGGDRISAQLNAAAPSEERQRELLDRLRGF